MREQPSIFLEATIKTKVDNFIISSPWNQDKKIVDIKEKKQKWVKGLSTSRWNNERLSTGENSVGFWLWLH